MKNATVKNFSIDGAMNITAENLDSNNAFGVVAFTVSICKVGNITSDLDISFAELAGAVENVGGIVGYVGNTTTITGAKDYKMTQVGGIVGAIGDLTTLTVQRCDSWGTISVAMGGLEAQDCYSGILAYSMTNTTYTIEDCAFYSTIENTGKAIRQVGGIVGYQRKFDSTKSNSIVNCLSVGTFSGSMEDSNGAIGGVLRNHGGTINVVNCYYRYDSDADCTWNVAVGSNTESISNNGSVTEGFTAKTEAELNSGEVTWLLNESLPAYEGDTTSLDSLVWHQDIDVEPKDHYPISMRLWSIPQSTAKIIRPAPTTTRKSCPWISSTAI